MQKISKEMNFEFASDDAQTGYRLDRMEVLNWGTFDNQIWKIEPNGFNSLLTGDIGSGKSTLVDAITTLLVQHNRITYNKAAGAEGKERKLYDYIRGAYAKLKGEEDSSAKAQFLRDKNSYTVLLASFHNTGYSDRYILAQVFWLKNDEVDKFFILADSDLTIKDHFTSFGSDISDLKKRLKKIAGVELLDSFKEYSLKFRSRFGILSDRALELFYQTVSLKSVNNLNEFIRENMLEKHDEEISSSIDELKKNFEDLNLSHEEIQKARKQIEDISPIISISAEYENVFLELEELRNIQESIPSFFAEQKILLLTNEVSKKETEIKRLQSGIDESEKEISDLRESETRLSFQIQNLSESREIDRLNSELKRLEERKNFKRREAERYNGFAEFLNLPKFPEIDENSFHASAENMKKRLIVEEKQHGEIKEDLQKNKIALKNNQDKITIAREELISLKSRKSLIPSENLKIRKMVLDNLNLNEEEIPFVGELLKVKDRKWEGAIEKVLHNFALSMLVPNNAYEQFSRFINDNNLRARVVYYRITSIKHRKEIQNVENPLIQKMEIKSDTQFYDWLESELKDAYNYSCAENISDFQKQQKAITKEGQIKFNQSRHEKDDRRNIDDRSNYVLGWNNKEKISSLEKDLDVLEKEEIVLKEKIRFAENAEARVAKIIEMIGKLFEVTNFHDLNWKKEATEIEETKAKIKEIESSSDKLESLNKQLVETKNSLAEKESIKSFKLSELGACNSDLTRFQKELSENTELLELISPENRGLFFPKITESLGDVLINLDSIEKIARDLSNKVSQLKNEKGKLKESLTGKLTGKMQKFKDAYQVETSEFDAGIESISEFKKLFSRLKDEDLPRFEEKFKTKLNRDVINGILLFKSTLENKAEDVKEKIGKINLSLHEIEYNKGTYIALNCERNQDDEIAKFKISLKNCGDDVAGKSELYNEEKFKQVKAIIDRFASGQEVDRKWTAKVTDVSFWFVFSATEKFISDDSEKESYSGSSGKSGGQKEKLAYTVLASALAYQFGLEWNEIKSKTFRFVVIDEAFGRGSDESTRYGLELFKKLNLQLLIVTPLQKIHVIEEYINACHLVLNKEGKNSTVKNLSIEEYIEQKENFHKK